jgi:hypothetical protein
LFLNFLKSPCYTIYDVRPSFRAKRRRRAPPNLILPHVWAFDTRDPHRGPPAIREK